MIDATTANAWLYAICVLIGSLGTTAGIVLLGDYMVDRWWERLTA